MQHTKYLIRFIFIITLGLTQLSFADTAGKYKIDFKFPAAMHWRLADNQQDSTGYMRTYLPKDSHSKTSQSVNFNYGSGVKTPLKDSMQEVLNVMAGTSCLHKSSRVLKQQSNYIIFSTLLEKCSNGRSLSQMFKVFNLQDGQYSIVYVADPHKVPAATIKTMQAAVVNANISKL